MFNWSAEVIDAAYTVGILKIVCGIPNVTDEEVNPVGFTVVDTKSITSLAQCL
jgi:hypothetical protein